jgi:anti-sigma factor RsiW
MEDYSQPEPMITCTNPELGDLFILYLNGDVTAEERRQIEEHLPHCLECQEELRFFQAAQKIEKER